MAEFLIGGLSAVDVPDKYSNEFLRMAREATGITNYLLPPLPNTLYTRDTTCWIYGGVTFNPLYWPVRREETLLTTAIYKFHPSFKHADIQVWWGDPDVNYRSATLEGGDVLPIGNGNVLIGMSERTSRGRPSRNWRLRCSPRTPPNESSSPVCRSCAQPCTWTRCLRSATATSSRCFPDIVESHRYLLVEAGEKGDRARGDSRNEAVRRRQWRRLWV